MYIYIYIYICVCIYVYIASASDLLAGDRSRRQPCPVPLGPQRRLPVPLRTETRDVLGGFDSKAELTAKLPRGEV